MELTKEQIKSLYGELQYTQRVSRFNFAPDIKKDELDYLTMLVGKELEKPQNTTNTDIKEEYKVKYKELTLTGCIAHPRYIYEYYLPDDFAEFKEQFPYSDETKEKFTDYAIYLNNEGKLVLASNFTPLVIGYKPKNI